MTNHEDIRKERDDLDRTIDAALARHAAAEPRSGLEERVLANLHSAARPANRTWRKWGLAAAVAVMLLIAITFAWRSRTPSHPAIANRPAPTEHRNAGPEIHVARRDDRAIPPRPRPAHKTHAPGSSPVLAGAPKLDQFPSPHPLSQQEKVLTSYIAQFHDEAVMVARAEAEALRKDREQEMREAGPDGNEDSQVR